MGPDSGRGLVLGWPRDEVLIAFWMFFAFLLALGLLLFMAFFSFLFARAAVHDWVCASSWAKRLHACA